MKTIRNERYQESYDVETLDNGLRVVIWHKPGYARSLFMMATPLGAMDICQVDEHGTQCVYPAGIAHFLEHKMFEKKDRDVMDDFSRMGRQRECLHHLMESTRMLNFFDERRRPRTAEPAAGLCPGSGHQRCFRRERKGHHRL